MSGLAATCAMYESAFVRLILKAKLSFHRSSWCYCETIEFVSWSFQACIWPQEFWQRTRLMPLLSPFVRLSHTPRTPSAVCFSVMRLAGSKNLISPARREQVRQNSLFSTWSLGGMKWNGAAWHGMSALPATGSGSARPRGADCEPAQWSRRGPLVTVLWPRTEHWHGVFSLALQLVTQ